MGEGRTIANKPILTIDVDDSAFERFYGLFSEYTATLADMPEQWKAIHEAMGDAGRAEIALAAAQAGVIASSIHDALEEMRELDHATMSTNKTAHTLGKTLQGVGKTVFGIATSMLRMGAIGLGLGALTGGFGFDALAGAALNRQRQANSLGIGPGALASFRVNAQQFLGTDALAAAANAQADISKAGYLAALGIDYGRARTQSPADLAFEELKAARRAWLQAQREGVSPLQTPAVTSYLALGGNVGDIRNAAAASEAEINAAQTATGADAGALGFDRATAAQWITLKKTLDEAGVTIETDLIKTLAPLSKEIAALSKEVVGAVSAFLGGDGFKAIVADARDGLKVLGDVLEHTDWKKIGGDLAELGGDLAGMLHILKPVLDFFGGERGKTAAQAQADWKTHQSGVDKKVAQGIADLRNGPRWIANQAEIGIRRLAGQYAPENIHRLNVAAAQASGVDVRILERLAADESGYGRNLVSPAGALGVNQFMPDTAKEFGINPLDPAQSIPAAAKYLKQLYGRYHDWSKAVAAYNWGAGNLDADISKHGADWLHFAPKETQGEVANVVGGNTASMDSTVAKALNTHAKALKTATRATKAPARVSIYNATDARVAISANAGLV